MHDDPENVVRLIGVRHEAEAGILVAALAERGIRAVSSGSYTSGFRAEAPGDVSVLVEEMDLERAKAALKEIQEQSADIDWSQVDVGEPE
jgi:Putative prokaryotic signal transducing protein